MTGAAFGGYVFTTVVQFAILLGAPIPGSLTGWNPEAIGIAATAVWWLGISWIARNPRTPYPPFTGMTLATAFAAGIFLARSNTVPVSVLDIVWTCLCGGLCLTLAHRRGVPARLLGIRPQWAATQTGRRQAAVISGVAIAGMCASSAAMGIVHNALPWVPVGSPRQTVMHGTNLLFHILAAGVGEELIVVAALVTALEAARRPAWQIYLIGMAARLSYHLYYGPLAITVLIFAAINLWLYRRTRRLTPLIATHLLFDAAISFGCLPTQMATGLVGLGTLLVLCGTAAYFGVNAVWSRLKRVTP